MVGLGEDVVMSDKCKQVQDSLLELAYGELPDEEADNLRMHAAKCDGCREALEDLLLTRKLAAQLPMACFGDDLDATILGAAAEATEQRLETAERPSPRVAEIDSKPGFFEGLRALLLRPAFATATLAILVCLLGFYVVKNSAKDEQIKKELLPSQTAEPVLMEAEEEKAKAAPARDEAAPELAAVDSNREDRLAGLGDLERAESAGGERLQDDRKSDSTLASRTVGKERRRAAGRGVADILGGASSAPRPVAASKKAETANTSTPTVDDSIDGVFASPPPASDLAAGVTGTGAGGGGAFPAGAATEVMADQEMAESEEPAMAEETMASPGDFADPPAQPAASGYGAAGPTSSNELARGIDAFARGDCVSAIAHFKQVAESSASPADRAFALHHVARCEKRRGRFAPAASWYEKLLARYPSYVRRPDAMFESANCLVRLGQIDKARARLEELLAYPAWRDRARKELDRLQE